MQNKKLWMRVIAISLFVAILISGCSKSQFRFTESDEWITKWQTWISKREVLPYQKGFYYVNPNNRFCYYDIDSEQALILCNKNGCNHKGKDCFADMSGFDLPIIHDDKLYFLESGNRLISANPDNTDRKKSFTFLEDLQEEGASVLVDSMLASNNYLFCQVIVIIHDENGDLVTHESRLYAIDWKTHNEILITAMDYESYTLDMISACDNVIYYQCQNSLNDSLLSEGEITLEQYQESERRTHIEVYRRNMKDEQSELVKAIDNGFVITTNDDIGVLYTQFAGTGYYDAKNMICYRPSDGEENEIMRTEDAEGMICYLKDSELIGVRCYPSKEVELYDIYTMEKLSAEWENMSQSSYAWKVPGGFAVPREVPQEGTSWEYGLEWKVLPLP